MSFFLGSMSDPSMADVNPEKMELAKFQFDTLSALQNSLFHSCAMKCIPLDYGEEDMNKGEMSCTDRCVAKFMRSYRLLSDYVQQAGFTDSDLKHYENIKQKLRQSMQSEKK